MAAVGSRNTDLPAARTVRQRSACSERLKFGSSSPEAGECLHRHKHSMKLDQFRFLTTQLAFQRREFDMRVGVFLDERAAAIGELDDATYAACHVKLRALRFEFKVKRPHNPSARLIRATHERIKPAGGNKDVIVNERDVFGIDMIEG